MFSFLPLFISGLLMAACQTRSDFPQTPFFQGLSSSQSYEEGEALLRSRLAERFPVGGPEDGLADFLRSQGFDVERKTGGSDPKRIFGFATIKRQPRGPQVVSVLWRAGGDGRLSEVSLGYGSYGMP